LCRPFSLAHLLFNSLSLRLLLFKNALPLLGFFLLAAPLLYLLCIQCIPHFCCLQCKCP
jgi:hypothetical protein